MPMSAQAHDCSRVPRMRQWLFDLPSTYRIHAALQGSPESPDLGSLRPTGNGGTSGFCTLQYQRVTYPVQSGFGEVGRYDKTSGPVQGFLSFYVLQLRPRGLSVFLEHVIVFLLLPTLSSALLRNLGRTEDFTLHLWILWILGTRTHHIHLHHHLFICDSIYTQVPFLCFFSPIGPRRRLSPNSDDVQDVQCQRRCVA